MCVLAVSSSMFGVTGIREFVGAPCSEVRKALGERYVSASALTAAVQYRQCSEKRGLGAQKKCYEGVMRQVEKNIGADAKSVAALVGVHLASLLLQSLLKDAKLSETASLVKRIEKVVIVYPNRILLVDLFGNLAIYSAHAMTCSSH